MIDHFNLNPPTRVLNHEISANLGRLLMTDPHQFIIELSQYPEFLSLEVAKKLDELDPLNFTRSLFGIDVIIPFAGHSLGPPFLPGLKAISDNFEQQKKLHEGHFEFDHPLGHESGHWFDCDLHKPSIYAAQKLLGFKESIEFCFTAAGLSENLAKLVETFFQPGLEDWKMGRTKIVILEKEFFSDQAVLASVINRAIKTAERYEYFKQKNVENIQDQIIKIPADNNGIYHTDTIISMIRNHCKSIKMLCLSDIVFNTGQRLELNKIFTELKDEIIENEMIVGLDLAHTVGNRCIDLESFPIMISFAVGCGYKHLCGPAGSPFGIYVNRNVDLNRYPPLQGWKAADSKRVFETINTYDATLMKKKGAHAFRISNPQPIAMLPVQVFLNYFNQIGFDKCFNKSESLTRYLILLLQYYLSEKIEFVTPLEQENRGAMIVFRIKNFKDITRIEKLLKVGKLSEYQFEIDVREPNIRLTAHYAYTRFFDIWNLVMALRANLELLYD